MTRSSATCSRSPSDRVYARAAREDVAPREALLREELRRRADEEARAGAEEVASALRTLGERIASFVDDGSYAYLLDRDTTVPADAPLVAFDTRKVPRELQAAVLFVLAEHVTSRIEARGLERLREPDGGLFAGRSMLVIDEAWKLVERRATGEWVNDIARRSRHLGLFLVAISQQLSDFAGPYGKALLRNSTQQLFLRQSPDELAYIKDARAALRRRGARDQPPEDGQARLLARRTGSTARAAAARSPCASARPSTASRPRTPSTTSRGARRRSTPATATPGRRSSSSPPRDGRRPADGRPRAARRRRRPRRPIPAPARARGGRSRAACACCCLS